LERERSNPKSPWYLKSEQDVNRYLENERKVLEYILHWFEELGIDWQTIREELNAVAVYHQEADEDHPHRPYSILGILRY